MFSDFQAAAIPTDDWLWLQVTATTGSPASLTLLIELQSGPPVLCCGGAGGVLEASMAIGNAVMGVRPTDCHGVLEFHRFDPRS